MRWAPPLRSHVTSRRTHASSRASAVAALVLLLGSSPPLLSAQSSPGVATASLGGRVVDSKTGRPLADVLVRIDGSVERASTGPDGVFTLYDLAPGARVIRLRYRGHAAPPQEIELVAHRHTEVRIGLALPRVGSDDALPVVALPPLGVEIRRDPPRGKLRGFYLRMEREHGHFITRDEILERSPYRTSDLLREVPGIVLARADFGDAAVGIGRHRRCAIDVFLDGIPTPGFRIDDLPPTDIAGIEVYRGVSEVPIGYRRHETCAAILIWTTDPARP
ncbi:MAG: carboxypeptidase regulatory-like domain-containing protein [Gemmatimonadota bacterium]